MFFLFFYYIITLFLLQDDDKIKTVLFADQKYVLIALMASFLEPKETIQTQILRLLKYLYTKNK